MKFKRSINILKTNSFILFGARGTGKSTLIQDLISKSEMLFVDLLKPTQERKLRDRPEELIEMVEAARQHNPHLKWVYVDEVQKIPELLDVVHHLIETTPLLFALTGSSARKLKRGGANLLAGRAFVYHLFPLTSDETRDLFSLDSALKWGTLPKVFSFGSDMEREMFLESYVQTYLAEEILEEQIIRKVVPFKKFLGIAGQTSGTIVNFAKIAADIGVDPKTVQTYFDILEETLIGTMVPAFEKSLRKQQLHAPKFYLFDTGVMRSLSGSFGALEPSSQEFGRLFEQFVINEIIRCNSYHRTKYKLYHWATHGGAEVDLVLESPSGTLTLLEIKHSSQVTDEHLKHLRSLHQDYPEIRKICICCEEHPRMRYSIEILPWKDALAALGFRANA
jgi:predicted AAA+ superfamily ATPase